MQKITMNSNNNGSQVLGEDNTNLSQDPPQAITITIMEPSSALGETLDKASISTTNLNSNLSSIVSSGSNAGTFFVMPSRGTVTDAGSSTIISEKEHVLQTSISKTQLEEEFPVISNISNPEEVLNEGQELTEEGEVYDEDIDGAASSGPHCLICNKELPQTPQQETPMAIFQVQTTTTQRKMSVLLGGLIGQKITSRKSHSDLVCSRCYNLLDKVDSLEVELQDTKNDIVNKYQTTLTVYGGRARRRKPATSKKTDFVFPKLEPDEPEREEVNLEFDSNFEPRDEDLLEEEADQQEDLIASGALDDEWEPEFKRSRLKRENTDTDPGVAPKRRRGRPRKDVTKPKGEELSITHGGSISKHRDLALSSSPGAATCPQCQADFSFPSQLRRHLRHEHPDISLSTFITLPTLASTRHDNEQHMEIVDDEAKSTVLNLQCCWCDLDYMSKDEYDQHIDEHLSDSYEQYQEWLSSKGVREILIKGNQDSNAESMGLTFLPSKELCQPKICTVCKIQFSSQALLEFHFNKKHERSNRSCHLCNEDCEHFSSLKNHVIHHFLGVMRCPVCPFRFSNRSQLMSHLDLCHSDGYTMHCVECNTDFESYSIYEEHQAWQHGHGAMRTCEICDKEVLALGFDKHLNIHNIEIKTPGAKPLACNICKARFMCSTQLYNHKYSVHSGVYTYKCDECGKRFKGDKSLIAHKWGHRYGSHKCPVCKLKFRQVDQLKNHIIDSHPEVSNLQCKFCPITFKNYTTYVAHLKLKHPKEGGYDKKPVRCKICNESFSHKMQWQYHMRSHILTMQTCEICGASVKDIKIHMNLHTKEKQFECKECGAIYHNKASYFFHMKRVHMGESVRKHLCDVCGKGFLTPADLKIHVGRVHRGERNYWCLVCNKGYKSKVSLTYHQRVHTGERPHQCTLCSRSFRIPYLLKRHLEHDHQTQYHGIYYKAGRPKSQEQRAQPRRSPSRSIGTTEVVKEELVHEHGQLIPEIVQITVPMEMGGEVISAVGTVRDHSIVDSSQPFQLSNEGVVYVVYEN